MLNVNLHNNVERLTAAIKNCIENERLTAENIVKFTIILKQIAS